MQSLEALTTQRILAIVPARGGSSLKDKNIRLFNGRPLIYWALDSLTSLDEIDKVVVSTDSSLIARCALDYGSNVEVWNRPKNLATDTAKVMDTMEFHCRNSKEKYDYVIMHHATAPMVDRLDIHNALKFMFKNDADFVISMCKTFIPLGICRPVNNDLSVKGWFPKELRGRQRQEMPQTYQLDNNIYMGKWDIFYNNKDCWDSNIMMFEMPQSKYADIDTLDDFLWAETVFKRQLEEDKEHWFRHFVKGCWNGRAR